MNILFTSGRLTSYHYKKLIIRMLGFLTIATTVMYMAICFLVCNEIVFESYDIKMLSVTFGCEAVMTGCVALIIYLIENYFSPLASHERNA